jgi:hypothetical protein
MLNMYYPQIKLDLQFAIRCGIVSAIASGGLFLSSFTYFRIHRKTCFILLLPIFPSLFFVAPSLLALVISAIGILAYSAIVFSARKRFFPQ